MQEHDGVSKCWIYRFVKLYYPRREYFLQAMPCRGSRRRSEVARRMLLEMKGEQAFMALEVRTGVKVERKGDITQLLEGENIAGENGSISKDRGKGRKEGGYSSVAGGRRFSWQT